MPITPLRGHFSMPVHSSIWVISMKPPQFVPQAPQPKTCTRFHRSQWEPGLSLNFLVRQLTEVCLFDQHTLGYRQATSM